MQSTFSSHGFELSDSEIAQFEQFLSLFIEYNTHTNLSAIRDRESIILKHFVDSLYGVSIIDSFFGIRHSDEGRIQVFENSKHGSFVPQDDRVVKFLDIGSGGGFPGIPLKIVLPQLDITLLDSIGKKVKAMNHFVENLGLQHIRAIQDRAENLAKSPEHKGRYDIVVSRATAYITDILTWAKPFITDTGVIVLYKMPSDEEKKDREKISKKLGLRLIGELPYSIAGADRIILVFAKR